MTGLEVRIEHIGSTAVQGLGAKPTIDIMAGVSELGLVDERYIRRLEQIGYEYVPKPEFPERMFLDGACGGPGRIICISTGIKGSTGLINFYLGSI